MERRSQSKKEKLMLSGSKSKNWKSSKPRKIRRLLKKNKSKVKSRKQKKRQSTVLEFPPT